MFVDLYLPQVNGLDCAVFDGDAVLLACAVVCDSQGILTHSLFHPLPKKCSRPQTGYQWLIIALATNCPNFAAAHLQENLVQWTLGWSMQDRAVFCIIRSLVTWTLKTMQVTIEVDRTAKVRTFSTVGVIPSVFGAYQNRRIVCAGIIEQYGRAGLQGLCTFDPNRRAGKSGRWCYCFRDRTLCRRHQYSRGK